MTDAEAEAALAALRQHYKEPVLPLSRFCAAITTWFRVIERLNEVPDESGRSRQGSRYHNVLRLVERDIRKSNLLGRLLYLGEKLRTVQCPTHNGRWTGDGDCACQGTGWMPAS